MTRSDGDRMDRAMDLMLEWFDSTAAQDREPTPMETARAIIRAAHSVGVSPHDLNRVSQNFLTEAFSPPEDKIRYLLSFLDA